MAYVEVPGIDTKSLNYVRAQNIVGDHGTAPLPNKEELSNLALCKSFVLILVKRTQTKIPSHFTLSGR